MSASTWIATETGKMHDAVTLSAAAQVAQTYAAHDRRIGDRKGIEQHASKALSRIEQRRRALDATEREFSQAAQRHGLTVPAGHADPRAHRDFATIFDALDAVFGTLEITASIVAFRASVAGAWPALDEAVVEAERECMSAHAEISRLPDGPSVALNRCSLALSELLTQRLHLKEAIDELVTRKTVLHSEGSSQTREMHLELEKSKAANEAPNLALFVALAAIAGAVVAERMTRDPEWITLGGFIGLWLPILLTAVFRKLRRPALNALEARVAESSEADRAAARETSLAIRKLTEVLEQLKALKRT